MTQFGAAMRAIRPRSEAELNRLSEAPLEVLLPVAEEMTLAGFGALVSYSRKVFIPLTRLCRDVCHYCTFATSPRSLDAPYLPLDEVLRIARLGERAGCKEALFTLGDRPEDRYGVAADWLADNGYASTLDYVEAAASAVLEQTGLLPHINPGLMDSSILKRLRRVSVSAGLMLESGAERLCQNGGPHYGSPDKHPAARLATLTAAGVEQVPTTTGLLIGLGDTRRERIDALVAIRALHEKYGHIQEIIIQNFVPKPNTRMALATPGSLHEQLWTIAATRLLFGPAMSIQAPPNLRADDLADLIRAGVNDWGGVSPVTPDHVNPEAPWPHLRELERKTESAGRQLVERLAVTPRHALDSARWIDPVLQSRVLRAIDSDGLAREDNWYAGRGDPPPPIEAAAILNTGSNVSLAVERAIAAAQRGELLGATDIHTLFAARGNDFAAVAAAADAMRRAQAGENVTFVVNRNINYTNICLYHCSFCAFSKGSTHSERGPAYRLDLVEIARRTEEAWTRGATEVCLQGGIHPSFTGDTYLSIVRAVKEAAPDIHVHAFSPLEITHGARTLGLSLDAYLLQLKLAGLSSLPGTAAEILDDEVRAVICPDKVTTAEWLSVMRSAHGVGLRSTATIMFGHVESSIHCTRHLMSLRALQTETGGFTEFVPLPFVHMEAPMWRRGQARSGPTAREALLMHAVGRLVLGESFRNVQTSWVKMGPDTAALALRAGANDLGGVLMDESITRAAGGRNGQCLDRQAMADIAASARRPLKRRTTLYASATSETLPLQLEPSHIARVS
jgi:FO synthase